MAETSHSLKTLPLMDTLTHPRGLVWDVGKGSGGRYGRLDLLWGHSHPAVLTVGPEGRWLDCARQGASRPHHLLESSLTSIL